MQGNSKPETPESQAGLLTELKDGLEELTHMYYNDPIRFIKNEFRVTPTKQQSDVLTSLSSHRKVSVRAGHGVGKSTLASWAVYWFLLTRPESRILCTAPTFPQLYDVLWAELAKWRRNSKLITNLFDWKQKRIECVLGREDWWASARTADKPESLQGRHADNFMLIVDEASGIDDVIFQAAEGMLTAENTYVLMISNPTRNQGYFYDTHNDPMISKGWSIHALSCLDSLVKDGGLVSQAYVDDMASRYGADSPTFSIRVLGEFPLHDTDSLIPHSWVVDAVEKEVITGEEPLILGVDVGAGGDSSAICPRKGAQVYDILLNSSKDTMEIVGWVNRVAQELKPHAICIDPIGIGKGGYDRLVELGIKNVIPVDVRRKATKGGVKKLRDELWWTLREQFESGLISIPNDKMLINELSGIKYTAESDSTIKVQSKQQMRKSVTSGGIGHSPDRADALMLTMYIEDTLYMEDGGEEEDRMKDTPTLELQGRGMAGY